MKDLIALTLERCARKNKLRVRLIQRYLRMKYRLIVDESVILKRLTNQQTLLKD